MIHCRKYTFEDKQKWDLFVDESKNGTFLLKRDYMDYHSDRFVDHSLLCYDDNSLIAILPASEHNDEIRSHGGLTYGGLIVNRKMTAQKNLMVFEAICDYYKEQGFKSLLYKRVPAIYYSYPSDEDLYSLFRMNAELDVRNISSTVFMLDKIRFNERRRRNVKKALKRNLVIKQSDDYQVYINMLSEVLKSRHDTKPVHNSEELSRLASSFPENIKMFCAFDGDEMLAGTVIYETPLVSHAQYIASSPEGRNCGALDYVFDYLINELYVDKKYFDFGNSNEDGGRYLNEGLVEQKQEFGGRGIVYDMYRIRF